MLIRVEPKDVAMFAVYFLFNKRQPDPEDEAVKRYLEEHGLSAKRRMPMDYHGTECDAMYFGSCYIGPHMNAINEIHRKGAEQALMARAIEQVIAEEPTEAARQAASALPEERLAAAKARLLARFNVAGSFGQDQEGYIVVTVPAPDLQAEFLKLAAGV